MKTLNYKIEFYTDWHTGSGLIGGTDANATVIKDDNFLPFIPGKTLKGLLRDAALSLKEVNANNVTDTFILEVFGEAVDITGNKENYDQRSSFFSNATLLQELAVQIPESHKKLLYRKLASTAIDENGQAKDKSLRQMEVSIPLPLYAYISDVPDNNSYLEALKKCFKWIKQLGINRTRGLGRCKFHLQNIS